MRPTEATIDLEAIMHNVRVLRDEAAPAELCVVVKADAYGHGAVAVARAAADAGATRFAVALVEEGIELRQAGIEEPILILSEARPNEMIEVVTHGLTPTVYSGIGLAGAAASAEAAGKVPLGVHLKIDTGMHRVGAHPEEVPMLVKAIKAKPALRLEGIWTHCAVADEPDHPATDQQFGRYDEVLAEIADELGDDIVRHAGNSAVLLGHRRGHYDMVRPGIAVYGVAPSAALSDRLDLKPAMTIATEVSFLKDQKPGDRLSYGLRHEVTSDTRIATIPIGYADGLRRSYWRLGGEVLIRGKRRPVVGVVTMDQTLVDVGPDGDVQVGDEVVIIGTQGDETISANEVATKLGTISYEVVCDVGRRVRRRYI